MRKATGRRSFVVLRARPHRHDPRVEIHAGSASSARRESTDGALRPLRPAYPVRHHLSSVRGDLGGAVSAPVLRSEDIGASGQEVRQPASYSPNARRTSAVLRTRPIRGNAVLMMKSCSSALRAEVASSTKTWL